MLIRLLAAVALASGLAQAAAPVAPAAFQKAARSFTEVPSQGFKFKAIDGYDAVPTGGGGDRDEVARLAKDQSTVVAYAFETPKAESPEGEKNEEGRSSATAKRREILPLLHSYIGFEEASKSPALDEELEVDDIEARRRRFEWSMPGRGDNEFPVFLELWSYPLKHADVHIVYFVLEEFDARWNKAIEKSGESFEQIERVALEEIDTSERTYESQLAWAEQEAAKTPGWQAIGTPSERFVILTNATKLAFVKEVIKRLEVSRDVYEKDFPPPADFKAVSVVRVCRDREEFQKFSGMGGGVAGYFSPSSVELVLYDDVETNRNSTYAVVSHEAFHQYCHFLFGQAEAHRWFDEGHGDYYGGMKITGKRGKITKKMPAGLDRYSVVQQMMREERTVPLEKHLNFSHGEWQQGGVPSYAQSWSIVYMLRQGALRKVSGKVWEDEYANIIPNYVSTLNKGFRDLYGEILAEREAAAEKRGRELTPEERNVSRRAVDPRKKEKIWKDAMEASWGQIDLAEFEENWKLYVMKYMK